MRSTLTSNRYPMGNGVAIQVGFGTFGSVFTLLAPPRSSLIIFVPSKSTRIVGNDRPEMPVVDNSPFPASS